MSKLIAIVSMMLISCSSYAGEEAVDNPMVSVLLSVFDVQVDACVEVYPNEKEAFVRAKENEFRRSPVKTEQIELVRQSPIYKATYKAGYNKFMKYDEAKRRKECDEVLALPNETKEG